MADMHLFVRALMRRDRLNEEEQDLLKSLPLRTREFAPGEEIIRQDHRMTESCLIVSGFAARTQYMSDGARQLCAIHVAGDFVDLHAFLLKVMDHGVEALGPCEAAFVPHDALKALTEKSVHLTRLLWMSTVIDGAIQRAWMTSLGRRTPIQRLSHLICEVYTRLRAVELIDGSSFGFPITQPQLGDVLGLSVVHTNRTLQQLRKAKLLTWKGGKVDILDFAGLSEFAEFDPTYLNLWSEPR